MRNRLNTLKTVPATQRASIIAQQLNTYGVKAENMTQDQQYQLAERQINLRARNSLYMTIFAIVVALICGAIVLTSSRGEPQQQLGGNPLLHLSPSVRDAPLRWDAGEFSPRPKQEGDPFAITVKNIGDRDAINLTLRFVLNLDTAELIKMARKSELFSNKHIEGDTKRLTIPTRFSLSETSWIQINLTEDNVVRRDELHAHSELSVSYPSVIKNAISLWLLVTSHSAGMTWRTKERENIPPNDPTVMMEYLKVQTKEMQRARILVLPDVTITIVYVDVQKNTFSLTNTIRLLYEYEWSDSWAKWTRDERPRRLFMGDLVNAWLIFHGIAHAPGDYSTGQPEGGEDQILSWNEAKLGPKPTDAELWFMRPFIRDQQQVLSGGQGILSYEDQNNPSEGRYNLYKNQDLFSQSNSSGAH
jgi:hypothetical protein